MPEPFTLYITPPSAESRAVLLHHALMGLAAPELKTVNVDLSSDAVPPEFLRANPLRTLPTLLTPWGPLWGSRTIMRFLAALCPDSIGYPTSVFHRASVDRLLDWDLESLSRCVNTIVSGKILEDKEPSYELLDELRDAVRFLDQKQLGDGRSFLTGNDCTIADISCHTSLSMLRALPLEIDDIPRVSAWQERMIELPGWDRIDAPFQHEIQSEAVSEPDPPATRAEADVPADTDESSGQSPPPEPTPDEAEPAQEGSPDEKAPEEATSS
jgi:glutathione S-transferase